MVRKKTPFSWFELFILQKSDAYTAKLLDRVANGLEHPTDLLIPTLVQGHFEPKILTAFQLNDFARCKSLVIDVRSAPKSIKVAHVGRAGDFDTIDLWNNPGLRHELRKLAIASEND